MNSILQLKRELTRWYVLDVLLQAQPLGLSEDIVVEAVGAAMPDVADADVAIALDYLRELDLVKTETAGNARRIDLTASGYQVAEGTTALPPGIRRPRPA